jgi:hypothetical protein
MRSTIYRMTYYAFENNHHVFELIPLKGPRKLKRQCMYLGRSAFILIGTLVVHLIGSRNHLLHPSGHRP